MSMSIVRFLLFFIALFVGTTAAESAWHRAESENFIVYMDGRESAVLEFTRSLERFNFAMAQMNSVQLETNPVKVRVFAVGSAETVQEFYRGNSGIDLGGFYRAITRGPYTVLTEPRRLRRRYRARTYRLLFHEYAHHFLAQYMPANYPGWYIEGHAEFYGEIQFQDDGEIKVGAVSLSNSPLLHHGDWIPLEDMLSNRAPLSMMLYAQAWLFVHYAFFDTETRNLLSAYLTAMQRGVSAEQAYIQTFGASGTDYDDVLQAYRDRGIPAGFLTLADPPEIAITIERISDAEAEVALLYPTDSVEGLALAEQAVIDNPEMAQAHVELARLRIEDGNVTGALAAANRALAIDSDDLEANLFKGIALTEMALDSTDDSSLYWAEARQYIARANRIFPNNALALYSYYRAFPDDESRPEVAVHGLERALELVPQSGEIRVAMINELVNQRRFSEARNALVPLLRSAHGAGTNEMAQSMRMNLEHQIQQIREYDRRDAEYQDNQTDDR